MNKQTLLALAAALVFVSSTPAATIIVVRHAERASGGMSTDVPLSTAGQGRAKELARVLKDAGVKTIITTDLQRTRQTAAPLAERSGIQAIALPAKDLDGLVKKLKMMGPDDVVLVVGHSNTVPLIVEQVGGVTVRPLEDTEYDRLFVVNTTGKPSVLQLRFGAE
jgi:broad specificity phosphatase PhoE